MENELSESQRAAFAKFSRLKIGALFMKMGTGKTRVAFMLADYNRVGRVVYVAPFSALANLEAERLRWSPKSRIDFIGYETISQSSRSFMATLESVRTSEKPTMIVADESIFIKNETSLRFDRLCRIRSLCDYALILNGTPITKNEWDIYNQMEFLSPRIIGMGREEFRSSFFTHVTYKKRGEKERDFWKFSEVNAAALGKMLDPYVFRCDLSLPIGESERTISIPCPMDEYQKAKEEHLANYMRERNSEEIVMMLNRLNHISASAKSKCKAVAEYADGKPVIVFYCFRDECSEICSSLGDRFMKIDGDTPKPERERIIGEAKTNSLPLLISFGCGSYSLNLQFRNEIVYSSLTFDYGRFEQSRYRIKRLGQEKDVSFTFILNDCGVNRMILENLWHKRNLDELVRKRLEKGDDQWLKGI